MTIIEDDGRHHPRPTTTIQADTLRLLFTYTIAFVIVVGGGILLMLTRNEPGSRDLAVITAGFIGSALTFVFGQETSARTARQSASVQSITSSSPTPPPPPTP